MDAARKIILEHGASKPFDPFDRYAQFEDSKGKTIGQLLDKFEWLRQGNIKTLAAMKLTPEQLALHGTHPELGAVTLEQLLTTWVCHDFNHIAQLAKAMAFQYGDLTGPWREYISILKPPVVLADRVR